jgi:regulator of protease activity HflC (stomatin/prohibitin superfamily)
MTLVISLVIVAIVSAAIKFFGGPDRDRYRDESKPGIKVLPYALIAAVVALGINCVTYAPTGTVKVISRFGKIIPGYLPDNGIVFMNPLDDATSVDTTPQDSQGGLELRTGTANDNFITADAYMFYAVNRETAWKILTYFPNYKDMVKQQATAALRTGLSKHNWQLAVKDEKQAVAGSVGTAWEDGVKHQLLQANFTQEEAQSAFTILPVRLQKALPDEVVQQATANRSAQEENLNTQRTLTEISKEQATRGTPEGQRMSNLIKGALGLNLDDPMPKLTPSEIVALLNAISTQERAIAMQKAVEDPKRPVTVIFAGDAPSSNVSVQAHQPQATASQQDHR